MLGTLGFNDKYENFASPSTDSSKAIYHLGYYSTSPGSWDPLVYSTLLRHGNYDAVNNAPMWDGNIPDRILPNSLYLASKPTWFGNLTWPPINPASGIPASDAIIPAGYRFVNGENPKMPSSPARLRILP